MIVHSAPLVRRSVRAKSLDVAGLLALVAHALAGGLRWAVTREMADFAAVVALLALGAVTYIHVSIWS